MMNSKRLLIAVGIILWSGFAIAAYFIVQKPLALQVADHLLSLAWTFIVTTMLLLCALALGTLTIKRLIVHNFGDTVIPVLACGIGLGELGLLGFGLAAIGATKPPILLGILAILLSWFIWRGAVRDNLSQIQNLIVEIRNSASRVPGWMKWAAALALMLTFLMTLLPPVEAYDALLYHLTIPELWLRDSGLRAYNIPPYWFPGIVEGSYLWGLGLGTDIVPQQLHFLWAMCATILLWDWSRKLWNDLTAWWVWMLFLSMPSLFLLASWAYTDMALTFFSIAALYSLWQGYNSNDTRWWRVAAVATGMAIGVKYTSFIVPLTAVILISIWKFREKKSWFKEMIWFGLIAGLTGCIWYLRNWAWMGNPFYPFVFGGRYWDDFRAALYAAVGTGAGWNLKAIASLPLTITLDYQDITAFDGNIGPLFLLALPMSLWTFMRMNSLESAQRRALSVIGLFVFLSVSFWTYGYITTRNLWQARLLIPAIIPFSIPAGVGILSTRNLDSRGLRISFIISWMAIAVIFINLLDLGLSVIYRNPLATATGITSRESFTEKFQPGYAATLKLVAQTPKNSRIYFLFEPRSYGASRSTQPDALLDNFVHDVFLYKNPEDIIHAWRMEGYTHVLVNKRGANFVLNEEHGNIEILNETLDLLKLISMSPNRDYSLYEINLQQ
jgi:4-amino-4-deoxy-L-arabinose transferase-like glycosyltransferase